MKRKKGFVFIETIVVSAILTVSLLMVFSSFNGIVIQENTRLKYNDPTFMYRTFYLQRFFKNTRLDLIGANLSLTGSINVMENFNCNSGGLFTGLYDNQAICESMLSDFHVRNIYLTYNDLSFVQNCNSSTGPCEVLNQDRSEMAGYLKTIGGQGKSGYRLIVEFSENDNGSYCEGDKCKYYYATISLGDL